MMAYEDIEHDLRKLRISLAVAEVRHGDISGILEQFKKIGAIMSAEMDRLIAEVEENKTVIGSAITLITTLADRVRAVAGDVAKANQLADELDAKNQELAAAIAANTPTA